MSTKITIKFLCMAVLLIASTDVFAANNPPPAYASILADAWFWFKTQGAVWGVGFACIAFGLTKMFNMDSDWAKKGANLAIGAGIVFALPPLIMQAFGVTGFALTYMVGG